MDECKMNMPPFFQCCCNCTQQVKLYDSTAREQVGFACIVFLEDSGVVTMSDEHCCGCECYYKKDSEVKDA